MEQRTCLKCGMTDRLEIFPKVGTPRRDGTFGHSRFCRYCQKNVTPDERRRARRVSATEHMRRVRQAVYDERARRAFQYVVLGPCRCQGCGLDVLWNGIKWIAADGGRHSCSTISNSSSHSYLTEATPIMEVSSQPNTEVAA